MPDDSDAEATRAKAAAERSNRCGAEPSAPGQSDSTTMKRAMISVCPYEAAHESAVRRFNRRLQDGGVDFPISEQCAPTRFPKRPGRPIWEESHLAVEADEVRGGDIIRSQEFLVGGAAVTVGCYRHPISEGVLVRRYAPVGLLLLRAAQRREKHLFSLGMGGLDRPLARLQAAAGWVQKPVPFLFVLARPFACLRGLVHVRKTVARRLACDIAAFSGMGSVGARLWGKFATRARPDGDATVEAIPEFDASWDVVWERGAGALSAAAVRDHRMLSVLYPAGHPGFIRLGVFRRGERIGWAVLLNTRMRDHRHFGNLQVGSIVDCLALPGMETEVALRAAAHLREQGAELILTNQNHTDWAAAFRACGFASGPTNFFLSLSPALAERVRAVDPELTRMHFTRGDGDGPINL